MPKKISNSQKTGNTGISILKILSNELGFLYRNINEDDFGIDGEIEILKNGEHLANKFQVQVKTSQKFKEKNGEIFIRNISRDDLEYWNNDINFPVFIVAVEISTEKVYWCDTRPFYEKIKHNKKQTSVRVVTNIQNELNSSNKANFIKFTSELNIYNSKKELIKSSYTEKIRFIANNKGYKIIEQRIGNKNTLILHDTELSKDHPINGKFLIKKNLGNNKFALSNCEIKIGDELIDNFTEGTIQILDYVENDELYLNTINHEYRVKVSKTSNRQEIILKSLDGELFTLNLSINFDTNNAKIELRANLLNIDNIGDLSDVLVFLIELKDGLNISVLDKVGKKKSILAGKINIDNSSINDLFVQYVKLLKEISIKFNFFIDINRLLEVDWTYEYIANTLPYLYSIVDGKYIIKNTASISFNLLGDGEQVVPNKEQFLRFIFSDFEIFGYKIPLDIYVEGKGLIIQEKEKYTIKTSELLFYTKGRQ